LLIFIFTNREIVDIRVKRAGRENPNKTETEAETEMKIYNFMDADTPIQGFHVSDPEVKVNGKWSIPKFTWKRKKSWRG